MSSCSQKNSLNECASFIFLQQGRTLVFSQTPIPSPSHHMSVLQSQLYFAKKTLWLYSPFGVPHPPPLLFQSIVIRGPSGVRALCSGCELGLFGGSRTPSMSVCDLVPFYPHSHQQSGVPLSCYP